MPPLSLAYLLGGAFAGALTMVIYLALELRSARAARDGWHEMAVAANNDLAEMRARYEALRAVYMASCGRAPYAH